MELLALFVDTAASVYLIALCWNLEEKFSKEMTVIE